MITANNTGLFLIILFSLMSVVLFIVMGIDKNHARLRMRRVPELTLFSLALLGGALGGVLGMQVFRHKTQHMNFVVGFPLIALLQWGLAIWLVLPG